MKTVFRASGTCPRPSSQTYLKLILETIQAHLNAHGRRPDVVWASAELHRRVVLALPATIGGVVVYRSHSLKGIAAVAICSETPQTSIRRSHEQ